MDWKRTPAAHLMPVALIGVLASVQAIAADAPAKKRDKQLQQRLEKGDAQAAALQKRIEQLERQLEELRTAVATVEQVRPTVRPTPVAATAPAAPPPPAPRSSPDTPPVAQAASRPASRPAGSFEVDEEAAQRALERTLTQAGALLLPARTVEVTPGLAYKRTEQNIPQLVTLTNGTTSNLSIVNQRSRRNEFTASLDLRAGLPYELQLELSLPYNYVRSSQLSELGGITSTNGSGVGDVTLGMAKTLTREGGWKPDLIGRLAYNFGNGRERDGTVELGSGFRHVQAELVALKRQDPLAFVASAFYQKTFEDNGIRPGNVAGLSLSAMLAASPATSMQFGFSQIYRQEQEQNGAKIAGSDQTYGLVTLGASSVLSRDVTLVTRVGIGVGNDAPKYSFSIALPILFR